MADYLEVWGPSGPRMVPLDAGSSMSIGRAAESNVPLPDDSEVSRLHAVLDRLPGGWCVRDLSSRNGTFVNGERVVGDRPLHHRDELRVGQTRVVLNVETPSLEGATAAAEPPPALTKREQDVLRALFLTARSGEVFTEPASTREMAAELVVSEAAVKQHLAKLYDKFGIHDGDRRRVRLANEAIRRGAVSLPSVRRSS